jgi:hypothetical protein
MQYATAVMAIVDSFGQAIVGGSTEASAQSTAVLDRGKVSYVNASWGAATNASLQGWWRVTTASLSSAVLCCAKHCMI